MLSKASSGPRHLVGCSSWPDMKNATVTFQIRTRLIPIFSAFFLPLARERMQAPAISRQDEYRRGLTVFHIHIHVRPFAFGFVLCCNIGHQDNNELRRAAYQISRKGFGRSGTWCFCLGLCLCKSSLAWSRHPNDNTVYTIHRQKIKEFWESLLFSSSNKILSKKLLLLLGWVMLVYYSLS